ncbi:hypothetical protein ACTWOG_001659 [Serratia marcescens]
MDNKLSELSKPEQFDAAVEIHGGEPFAVWAPAVYFALLAELEAKSLECRGIEQERELFRIERTAHQQHAQELEKRVAELSELETQVKVWESAATKHLARAEEAEKRLEESRETTLLVRDAWQKDKERADAAEKWLATPVRLPRPACTYADHSYPAYSRKQVEEIITSAGMRFTVEGDE